MIRFFLVFTTAIVAFGCSKERPIAPVVDSIYSAEQDNNVIAEVDENGRIINNPFPHNTFFFNRYIPTYQNEYHFAWLFPIYFDDKWSYTMVMFNSGTQLFNYATGLRVDRDVHGFVVFDDERWVKHIECTCDTIYDVGAEKHFDISAGGVLYWFVASDVE